MDAREFVAWIGWMALSNDERNTRKFPLDTRPFEGGLVRATDGINEYPLSTAVVDGEMNIRIVFDSKQDDISRIGLYICTNCRWMYIHPTEKLWSTVIVDEHGDVFPHVPRLMPWLEWKEDYGDCVGNIRLVK